MKAYTDLGQRGRLDGSIRMSTGRGAALTTAAVIPSAGIGATSFFGD